MLNRHSITMLFNVCAVLVLIIFVTYLWIRKQYAYFKNIGIKHPEPELYYGNTKLLNKTEDIGTFTARLYNELKVNNKAPVAGFYSFFVPSVLVTDVNFIKTMLVKDFSAFMNRGIYHNKKDDPLSAHLFAIDGMPWKDMRKKLTPTFTSGKMKYMFSTMLAVSDEFTKCIDTERKMSHEIEMKDILARFTTDVIGSCAFGLECNSLKDPTALFREMGRRVFATNTLNKFQRIIVSTYPRLGHILGIRAVRKDVSEFFTKCVYETVEYRQKNNVVKNDFLNLLLDIGKENEADGLTINEIAAQAFIFFLAGFETSSTAMSFAMYELALDQELQNKARSEVNEVLKKHGGKMSYETMMDMKYIKQIIDESLRKYPPLSILLRRTIRDYKIEGTDIVLEKGVRVIIPVLGIHHDPQYYPEPEKFDPERFAEPAVSERNPYAFLPFGEGPRNCIGLRFGIMQAVLGLASLLRDFKFTMSEKTICPIEFDPNLFILTSKGGLWLNVERIL